MVAPSASVPHLLSVSLGKLGKPPATAVYRRDPAAPLRRRADDLPRGPIGNDTGKRDKCGTLDT